MWYTTKIQVQQSETFYSQVDAAGSIIATNCRKGANCIDRTVYTFKGCLGEVFSSTESKKPEIGDERYIFGTRFVPYTVRKKGVWPFISYEVSWVSPRLKTYEDIATFYMDHLWRQLPRKLDGAYKSTDAVLQGDE